jgi:hypothetical protein
MDIIVLIAIVLIGLLLLKSAAGIFKLLLKIAIYAAIGYGIYRLLLHFGLFPIN